VIVTRGALAAKRYQHRAWRQDLRTQSIFGIRRYRPSPIGKAGPAAPRRQGNTQAPFDFKMAGVLARQVKASHTS